jgi:hypothetical protein
VWSRRAWGPASALRAAVRGERRREAASGGARGERSPTARGWPERLLIWAYMMSCVTCRERLKIPVCETVWHVHACSCRPAEAPRQTTRELISTAQEAGGVKPATRPQSTAPPEGGPREAAHTAGGAQRPPIGVNARTGSATVCEPSLRTHRPQPKPTLTRGHPRRGGVGGVGCSPALRRRRAYTASGTRRSLRCVGQCVLAPRGSGGARGRPGAPASRVDSSGAVPTQSQARDVWRTTTTELAWTY